MPKRERGKGNRKRIMTKESTLQTAYLSQSVPPRVLKAPPAFIQRRPSLLPRRHQASVAVGPSYLQTAARLFLHAFVCCYRKQHYVCSPCCPQAHRRKRPVSWSVQEGEVWEGSGDILRERHLQAERGGAAAAPATTTASSANSPTLHQTAQMKKCLAAFSSLCPLRSCLRPCLYRVQGLA